jgi:hypothetical protein
VAEDAAVDELAAASDEQQRARQQPGLDVALGEEAVDAGEAVGVEADRAGRGEGVGHAPFSPAPEPADRPSR